MVLKFITQILLEKLEEDETYKEYIESTYNKPCNMYLYSIKKDIFKKL